MNCTEIIKAIVELIVAVLTVIVIPKLRDYLYEKAGAENLARWQKLVEVAVAAAEQTIDPERWQAKKEFVREWLIMRGIEYDPDTVDSMIEAAVIKLHNELKGGAAE